MKKITRYDVLIFLGGAVASMVTSQALKCKGVRKLTVNAVAKGLKAKDDIEHTIASIKEEAEDVYNEAKLKNTDCCCEGDCDKEVE